MREIRRITQLALVSVIAGGCYTYAPVESPQPGMDVRAQLRAEAAARRSEGMDVAVMSYDGRVVEATPQTLSLDVLIARRSSAIQDITLRDTVTFQSAELFSVMQRKISAWRTALAVAALGAGGYAVVAGIDQVVGSTGGDDNGGVPTFRLPLISWMGSRVLPGLAGGR